MGQLSLISRRVVWPSNRGRLVFGSVRLQGTSSSSSITYIFEVLFVRCPFILVLYLTRPLGVLNLLSWAVAVSWTRAPLFFNCSFRFHLASRLRNSSATKWFQLSGSSTTRKPIMSNEMPPSFMSLNSTLYTDASTTVGKVIREGGRRRWWKKNKKKKQILAQPWRSSNELNSISISTLWTYRPRWEWPAECPTTGKLRKSNRDQSC